MKTRTTENRKTVWEKRLGWRFAQIYAAIFGALIIPSTANAKISDWIKAIGDEFAAAVPIIVVILGGVGIALAGFGILSAIMAKKNQKPLDYQGWFVGGGTLLLLLIPFVISMGESMSGQDAESTVKGVLGNT